MAVGGLVQRVTPWVEGVLGVIYPSLCPLCDAASSLPHRLCAECRDLLPKIPERHCLRCGADAVGLVDGCGQCLGKKWAMDRVYFPFCHEGPVRELIIGLKFSDHSEWADAMIELAMERVGGSLLWEEMEMVVPVPLHPARLLWRRYNQSSALAGRLARKLARPLVTHGLARIRKTHPQSQLGRGMRVLNVKGAFRACAKVVKGRSVLLVDDVFTTGSTVAAAVEALKQAQAERVVVFCLSRAGDFSGGDHHPFKLR